MELVPAARSTGCAWPNSMARPATSFAAISMSTDTRATVRRETRITARASGRVASSTSARRQSTAKVTPMTVTGTRTQVIAGAATVTVSWDRTPVTFVTVRTKVAFLSEVNHPRGRVVTWRIRWCRSCSASFMLAVNPRGVATTLSTAYRASPSPPTTSHGAAAAKSGSGRNTARRIGISNPSNSPCSTARTAVISHTRTIRPEWGHKR